MIAIHLGLASVEEKVSEAAAAVVIKTRQPLAALMGKKVALKLNVTPEERRLLEKERQYF